MRNGVALYTRDDVQLFRGCSHVRTARGRKLKVALTCGSAKRCPTEPIQGVQTAAAMNAEATEAGAGVQEVDFEALAEAGNEIGQEAGLAYGVEGAEGGVGQMVEAAAADEIVEGHQYYECV